MGPDGGDGRCSIERIIGHSLDAETDGCHDGFSLEALTSIIQRQVSSR